MSKDLPPPLLQLPTQRTIVCFERLDTFLLAAYLLFQHRDEFVLGSNQNFDTALNKVVVRIAAVRVFDITTGSGFCLCAYFIGFMREIMKETNNLETKILRVMKNCSIYLFPELCCCQRCSNFLFMRRILPFVFLFFFGIFLFLLVACKKESDSPTIIVGQVTDAKSGLPVEKAILECGAYKGEIGHEIFKDFTTSSNAQGQYEIIVPNDYNRVGLYRAYKAYYLTKILPAGVAPLLIGDSNTVDIEMIPIDGFLRLSVRNTAPEHDSIFIKFLSPTVMSEGLGVNLLKNYPLVLPINKDHFEIIEFPSDESIIIYWDFKSFSDTNALNNYNIYLPAKDTVDFLIEY